LDDALAVAESISSFGVFDQKELSSRGAWRLRPSILNGLVLFRPNHHAIRFQIDIRTSSADTHLDTDILLSARLREK
jgi:hypothetical protein